MQHSKKISSLAIASILIGALHAPAWAAAPPPPVPLGKAPLAVKAGSVGIIGVAATLGLYDIVRRLSCNDFVGLGGPGFSRPQLPTDNAIVPQNCAPHRR